MKAYYILVEVLETELPKDWNDMTDADWEDAHDAAAKDLRWVLNNNNPKAIKLRFYLNEDDALDQVGE